MTQNRWIRRVFGLAVLMATATTPAAAQPLGVFRWQQQPFCNVLNLAVTATPSGFRMEGTDDQCGGVPASAIGMAYFKTDGTVGVGLTLVFGSAVALHVDGTINPGAGFNGSWSDSVGRNGTLVFGPGTGGPLRPVVAPVAPGLTYGSIVAQPAGGADRGVSATVTADTGTPNDAAGLYGRFGGPLALTSPAPAGVHGASPANVGVMGLTDTGFGTVGGADTGVGVQGYATGGANSIAVQAVHLNGGTALNIHNGTIKMSGGVRSAFTFTVPSIGASSNCWAIAHPLLTNDPNALVFVTSQTVGKPALSVSYFSGVSGWLVCTTTGILFTGGDKLSVLVIKQ